MQLFRAVYIKLFLGSQATTQSGNHTQPLRVMTQPLEITNTKTTRNTQKPQPSARYPPPSNLRGTTTFPNTTSHNSPVHTQPPNLGVPHSKIFRRDSSLRHLLSGLPLGSRRYRGTMAFSPNPNDSHNLQISEVINSLADSEPELFNNETATLMAVKHSESVALGKPVICDKRLNKTLETPELTTLRHTLMEWARSHADEQARYWRELLTA